MGDRFSKSQKIELAAHLNCTPSSDRKLIPFLSYLQGGKVTSSVIEAMEGSIPADKPLLVLLDIPEGGKYSIVEADTLSPDLVDKVIEDYSAGKLTMKQLM